MLLKTEKTNDNARVINLCVVVHLHESDAVSSRVESTANKSRCNLFFEKDTHSILI